MKSILKIATTSLLLLALTNCTKDESKENPTTTPAAEEPTVVPTAAKTVAKPGANAGAEVSMPSKKGSVAELNAAGKYDFDPGHSQVLFQIEHFGVSQLTGLFRNIKGGFVLDDDASKSSVQVEIDAASVFTAVQKRDDHLKGPDFFDVKQFPTVQFKSDKVENTGTNTYDVTGDLLIHGIKKTVTIPFTLNGAKQLPKEVGGYFVAGFSGAITLNRHEFGLNYGKGLIGDDVLISISLEGKRL